MVNSIKNDYEELIKFGQQWDEAMINNDPILIEQFMSDDWVIIGTEGGITPKNIFLDFIKSGSLLHNKMDFEDLRVKVYKNTGIVTSKGTSSGTYNREPFSFFEWSTSMYLKTEGRWLCVLTMLTPALK